MEYERRNDRTSFDCGEAWRSFERKGGSIKSLEENTLDSNVD